jgi:hypothetical protein
MQRAIMTVEECKALVAIKEISVIVATEPVLSKDNQRIDHRVNRLTINNESDLTPEIVMDGPNVQGEVNGYVLTDGFTAYFDAKTGEAIGREIWRDTPVKRDAGKKTILRPLRNSPSVDRRMMEK